MYQSHNSFGGSTNGAYTESISISPELTHIFNINYAILTAGSGLGRRWIQTNIIKVHCT